VPSPPPPRLTTPAEPVRQHLFESSRLVKSIVSTIRTRSRHVCSKMMASFLLMHLRMDNVKQAVLIVLEIRPVELLRHYLLEPIITLGYVSYLIILIARDWVLNKHVECEHVRADRHRFWFNSKEVSRFKTT
jgi:hypothetical protein